jgi:hypothetical protein
MFTDAAERPTNEQLRHYMKRFQKQIGKKSKSKIPSFLGQLSFFQRFTAQAELVLLPNQTVPNYVHPSSTSSLPAVRRIWVCPICPSGQESAGKSRVRESDLAGTAPRATCCEPEGAAFER